MNKRVNVRVKGYKVEVTVTDLEYDRLSKELNELYSETTKNKTVDAYTTIWELKDKLAIAIDV